VGRTADHPRHPRRHGRRPSLARGPPQRTMAPWSIRHSAGA